MLLVELRTADDRAMPKLPYKTLGKFGLQSKNKNLNQYFKLYKRGVANDYESKYKRAIFTRV